MEFKLISPQGNKFANLIEFNHEELKAYLSEQLVKYKGLTYSPETIGEAKNDRAALNKLKTAIDDKRKEIKKECLKPYEEFEAKVKELLQLIDEPILAIDNQIKEYENGQKEEKKAQIEAFYDESIGNLEKLLPLSRIWNDRWLNVTFSFNDIMKEIAETIKKATDDIAVIADLKSEFELQIKDKYLQTLDLSAALKEKARLEDQKIKMQEYEKAREQAQQAEVKIIGGGADFKDLKPGDAIQFAPTPDTAGALEQIDFRVWVTKAQKQAMRQFFITNKIKVGKVE